MKIKLGSRKIEASWATLVGAPQIPLAKPIKFNLHCHFPALSLPDFLPFTLVLAEPSQVTSTSFPMSFMVSHNPLPKRGFVFTSYLSAKAGEDLDPGFYPSSYSEGMSFNLRLP